MNKVNQVSAVVLLLCSMAIQAGTVVEIQNQGELTRVITDGQQARINISASEYVIVNYNNHSVRVVDPQKRQVMLLNADVKATGNSFPTLRTSINNLGPGQVIAGYTTQKYSYSANGKTCGVIYGSKQAYQARGIKQLMSAMETMMAQQSAVLGGLAAMIDDCTLADMKLSDHVSTIGVPMRTEKNGRIDTQIKSIRTDVALPANTFVIPASYKTVTMQEQMNAASNNMAAAQQVQRNDNRNQQLRMQQMMRQMQQSGQLTPEMMQQMRRTQEMMNQYQQR